MNEAHPPTHTQVAIQFYNGMVQATLDVRDHGLPQMIAEFEKRGIGKTAEQAFNINLHFYKRHHLSHNGVPRAATPHAISRFTLEYFCCLSAINLYRLPQHVEKFKAELLEKSFYAQCAEHELEWLGVYNAEVPNFKRDTGHNLGQWRIDIVKAYLIELNAKSSRDQDTLVAMRRFLHRQELSKGAGVAVSPVMQEACTKALESKAGWLKHYLQFHPL